jgi:hypothetical protein
MAERLSWCFVTADHDPPYQLFSWPRPPVELRVTKVSFAEDFTAAGCS